MKKLLLLIFLLIPCGAWAGSTATSGATASDFITEVRRDLAEASAGYWADADLLQWIDEAVWEIVIRTGCLESGASNVVLQENTRQYSISGSYLYVYAVEFDSGDTTSQKQVYTLDRVDKRDIGHNQSKGNPQVYCVWNDTLEVWPIPRSDQSGTTLYVYLADAPSGVTATTSAIETPAYFDTAIKHYVKARALDKDDQGERSDRHMAVFDNRVELYFRTVTKRGVEQLNVEGR